TATDGTQIYFPCPFKETEATVALKSIEACAVAAIADVRYGGGGASQRRRIEVNLERTATFLFSTYIATIAGLGKQNAGVKAKLKNTDLLSAQSILYRRLSANLYETKNPGEYFHIHGSLEAGKTLNMIGLEAHRPDLTEYRQCIDVIESHVKQFTAAELEEMNAREKQAGVTALKWEDFQKTEHGKALCALPPWELTKAEDSSPPIPFPESLPQNGSKPQVLAGIRVLELCRIIAGPAMGRTLAEYGAQVIKVTSPNLSDVPFFQVDGNTGKHTCDLDLKTSAGRQAFGELLQSADVVLDGYRPGSLDRLGYGPQKLAELAKRPWAGRPGWQQIADCVTGVAWAQGHFMGLEEPVVPPFPMSDYGTGCMGAIAALIGLWRRATEGGSWVGRTSLSQYDIFLLGLGLYGEDVKQRMRADHDEECFGLRHADSVDELFDDKLMQTGFSKGFGEEIKWCRSPVEIEGLRVGFERASRPNGFDKPSWEGWEVEKAIVEG
ncbi:Succinyl-CoA--L-malate CoA-transferase beta subunit, partial [Lachnellula suecica]